MDAFRFTQTLALNAGKRLTPATLRWPTLSSPAVERGLNIYLKFHPPLCAKRREG